MSPPLSSEGTLPVLPISLRLAKPGAMGVCLGDLPRLGALDDHCLLPSPRAFSLQGEPNGGGSWAFWGPWAQGWGAGRRVAAYLSSPPARSFCSVELGPQVRPFFLPPTSSSFFGGPLRPHVPLPPLLLPLLLPPPLSTGVTGPREATWLQGLGEFVPAGLPASLPPWIHPPPGSRRNLDSNSNRSPPLL